MVGLKDNGEKKIIKKELKKKRRKMMKWRLVKKWKRKW